MAHIRYGARNYAIPDESVDDYNIRIQAILAKAEPTALKLHSIVGSEEFIEYLWLTPGTAIAVHNWDAASNY